MKYKIEIYYDLEKNPITTEIIVEDKDDFLKKINTEDFLIKKDIENISISETQEKITLFNLKQALLIRIIDL